VKDVEGEALGAPKLIDEHRCHQQNRISWNQHPYPDRSAQRQLAKEEQTRRV
jgi:hypothetical protein